MNRDFDIVIAGSGFAGSLLAMIARRLGRTVLLLERDRHPRFAIGESSTPLANLLLEELARRYDLPRLLPFTKWGTWQRAHPEIACGLKRGFTFCHHQSGEPFTVDKERHRQLMVAASPHDEIADTHWFREDFDAFLVGEAQRECVEYLDAVEVREVRPDAKVVLLRARHNGHDLNFTARFLIDATGPRGLLHRALGLGERTLSGYPATQSLFTHFRGVHRLDELMSSEDVPPYPVDDAALHHVFPGGWIWVLRFNNGVTSAGVAVETALANELRLAEGRPAWQRLLERLPTVREQFADSVECRPFVHQPRLAFASAEICGPNWALLPSAAGFVDPLLSTGFPLTLLGVSRLARIIEDRWQGADFATGLTDYARLTATELDTTAAMVGALYRSMDDPPLFNALTQLYFAAASYAESARRLGRPELATGFLLHAGPGFGEQLQRCLTATQSVINPKTRSELLAKIPLLIEPINVAGLANPARRNWYPARAEDLLNAAGKL
ncbi:MAG TPA: tryptophan 7-halogenase, partial [Verrucomicrobiae bacterium]|nr:tryptophan 7-halogenase [Verrucomicrobiae bacterium]